MSLTPEQLVTFKADIDANTNATVIAARNAGNNRAISDWYSLDNADGHWVFKIVVPLEEVSRAIELDDVANMTTNDNEKLKTFFVIRPDGVFANKATDRDGFDDIFSAAAGDDSQQALIALWKRLSTNIERLFATTPGAGTNADPATLVVEGGASLQDVRNAVALP